MRLASVIFFMFAVLLASGTEAAVYRANFWDPAHPGKCVAYGLVINPGQKVRHPKLCGRIVCWRNGQAEIQTCGSVGLSSRKKLGYYKIPNSDYPDCCIYKKRS